MNGMKQLKNAANQRFDESETNVSDELVDNISVKSFNSSSFEPDFSDIVADEKKQNKRNYMKEYMRDYRLKQKQKEEERRQLTKVRNQLVSEKESERLLLNALTRLILILNDNQQYISNERIIRLNEQSNDIIKYGDLIIQTFDELREMLMK